MPANVLIQTAFLGDLLLSIPLMKRMKMLWPQQALVLVCRKGVGSFFLSTGLVDEILEVKKNDADSYESALAQLKSKDIDHLISAHSSLRTAFFVRGLKASVKVGFKTWWNGLFYDQRIVKDLRQPDAIRQLSLLQNFDSSLKTLLTETAAAAVSPWITADPTGSLPAPPAWASMSLKDFYSTQAKTIEALSLKFGLTAENMRQSVALFPGSVWATKRWTKEGFVALGQRLSEGNIPVLVMGGPGEEALCAEVASQIPRSLDLSGKTAIFESALLLSQVAAVVGNDSASLHLAATAETPSVAVFGPTVLKFGFRPWQPNVVIAEIADLPCRPCGKHGHQVCPIGTHACMKGISAEHVHQKLQRALLS